MSARKGKTFDCVEMKRRLQERIYAETKDLGPEELLEYFHRRVAATRFARFFSEGQAATQKR